MSRWDDEIGDTWTKEPPQKRIYDGIERPSRTEDLVRRTQNGRPYIKALDPETGQVLKDREVTMTRVTTYIKCVDDTSLLEKWIRRQQLKGFAMAPDYFVALTMQHFESREALNDLCEEAAKRAAAGDRAAIGTAVHALTEQSDRNWHIQFIPEKYQADLLAWLDATQHFEMLRIEEMMVNDDLGTAGTPDRVVGYHPCTVCGRRRYILDLKGLALDTPLPTPTGWTTMGEVRPGEQVLGRDGKPCTVTAKSATKQIGTYIVTFDDGATVICDSEHLWETTTGQPAVARTTVKDIETIRATLFNKYGQRDHRVALPDALELPEVKVPIEPYLLGVWIGDGAVRGGTICKERDLFEVLEADGVPLGVEQVDSRTGAITRTALGLTTLLREAGLLYDKRIPEAYLRGSYEQRLRLLQGLMDTDGTWNTARRTAVFNTVSETLARQVEELALTLGQNPYVSSALCSGFGLTVRSWSVQFTPIDVVPFRLPRKADQAAASTKRTARARRRVVVAVEPGPDVETACIAVDAPDRMYLCGRRMVPTHNTGRVDHYTELQIAMQLGLYANSDFYDHETGIRTPHDDICRCRAIVVNLPAGTGEAMVQWVDIYTGWQTVVEVARRVREARKKKNLVRQFMPTADLLRLIATAESRQELDRIYTDHRGIWTSEHTAAANERLKEFTQ